ncbi:hypothetical protein RRG08_058415 [Elysia crispata]|uniref:Uncharacterized protein n=1 Tax=Elysia crispata TaxID=231223 RepID=A0AAE1CNM3_9GAST|nr:hypothetical protein RRG08_058415 [Elysia crispata]
MNSGCRASKPNGPGDAIVGRRKCEPVWAQGDLTKSVTLGVWLGTVYRAGWDITSSSRRLAAGSGAAVHCACAILGVDWAAGRDRCLMCAGRTWAVSSVHAHPAMLSKHNLRRLELVHCHSWTDLMTENNSSDLRSGCLAS